ncbi:TPR-like protein [Lojkania enalia]|uniref:TPR-like protein n=1 Tax=Lojkania enalia TaxID=147567 RepID=A0A9P4N0E1_9PLEO|nr:TPR-like protein [Didymosphaeria enalia]
MVEPLTVVGSLAACLQLAKWGIQFIELLTDHHEHARFFSSDTISHLSEDINGFLLIARSINPKSCKVATAAILESYINRCTSIATRIQITLSPLVIGNDDSTRVKFRKIASFRKKTKNIARLLSELERCKAGLHLYLSSLPYQGTDLQDTTQINLPLPCQSPTLKGIILDLPPKLDFIGREPLISLVLQCLSSQSLGRKGALVGLGGIGKSQTALECAHRIRELSPNTSVFWIRASNHTTFMQGFTHISQHIFLSREGDPGIVDIKEILAWLNSSACGPWLMIVDDIDLATFGDREVLDQFLLDNKFGSILFTTRNKQSALALVGRRSTFFMAPMAIPEARQLLNSELDSNTPSRGDSMPLLTHLNCLPLAISQAAAYMRMKSMSPTAYLELLNETENGALPLLGEPGAADLGLSRSSLISSFVSIDAIKSQSLVAGSILFTMACIEPSRMPRSLFADGKTLIQLCDAFGLLKAYSLITSNEANYIFSMHSLIHSSIRSYLKSNNIFQTHVIETFRLLAGKFPKPTEQYLKLSECDLYLPHALAVWKLTAESENGSLIYSIGYHIAEQFASRISRFLRIKGRYNESKKFAERAHEWAQKEYGLLSARSLMCRSNIAIIDHYLGNYKASAKAIDDILLTQVGLLEAKDPAVVSTLSRKAESLRAQDKHEEAENYYRQAVLISESIHGPDHLKTLDAKHGLALCLLGQTKYAQALTLLHLVLDAMQDVLGSDNPKTLSVLSNIGCTLQLQQRWPEACAITQRVLAGREAQLGARHPHTLQCKANLAELYIQHNDLEGAERLTREALHGHQETQGKDHPLSLHILNNLALVLHKRGRLEEAERMFARAVSARERVLGDEHHDTMASLSTHCKVLRDMGRFGEASGVGRRVLSHRRRLLGEGHPDTIAIQSLVEELESGGVRFLARERRVDSDETVVGDGSYELR